MRSIIAAIALMVPLLTGTTPSVAQSEPILANEAEAFVGELAKQALGTLGLQTISLDSRQDRFRQILREGFEIRYIGLLVLGKHRRTATREELDEYHYYFAEFILKKYSALLGGYAGETLSVVGSRPSGRRDVLVKTEIRRQSGPPIPTEWRVRRFSEALKVIDIKVEGISMVQSQREEFNSILTREGMTGLLAVLRARTGIMPAETPA